MNVMRQFVVENERAGRDSTRVINLFDRIMEQDQDDAQMPMLYAQYLLAKKMLANSKNCSIINKHEFLCKISAAGKLPPYRP